MKAKAADYTIYPSKAGGTYEVRHWHTYPSSSVLSGQQQEIIDDFYNTLEEAKLAHPKADVSDGPHVMLHRPSVSPCPPSNFSYYDAGEHWHEDDY